MLTFVSESGAYQTERIHLTRTMHQPLHWEDTAAAQEGCWNMASSYPDWINTTLLIDAIHKVLIWWCKNSLVHITLDICCQKTCCTIHLFTMYLIKMKWEWICSLYNSIIAAVAQFLMNTVWGCPVSGDGEHTLRSLYILISSATVADRYSVDIPI